MRVSRQFLKAISRPQSRSVNWLKSEHADSLACGRFYREEICNFLRMSARPLALVPSCTSERNGASRHTNTGVSPEQQIMEPSKNRRLQSARSHSSQRARTKSRLGLEPCSWSFAVQALLIAPCLKRILTCSDTRPIQPDEM